MSEKIKSEMISRRRAFSLLGLAALGLAVPLTVLTVSDAEAQQQPAAPGAPPGAPPPGAPMTGTERRQERRTRRVSRRKARRKGRAERRELRRTGSEEKK